MKQPFKALRLRQLSRNLAPFEGAKRVVRPHRGWLRAVREGLNLSLEEVGRRLNQTKPTQTKTPRQDARYFEIAESKETITLKNLRRAANALGCQLVYAIVPKSGSIEELAAQIKQRRDRQKEQKIRDQVRKEVLAVEHTMALEDQAPGDVDTLIEEETKRRLRK
jgi:predicted DNA-binding mobile mystery protein A